MNEANPKKQYILEIAKKFFTKYGYVKTSLDDIALEAGIAKGTIYYYFESKQELFMNILAAQAEEFVIEMKRQVMEKKGFENKLRHFMLTPIRYFCKEMPIWLESLRSIPFSFQEDFEKFHVQLRQKMQELLIDIVREGIAEGMISKEISEERLCEVLNDWFLLGNQSLMVADFEKLLKRVERDHETLVNIIMYGIIKRG